MTTGRSPDRRSRRYLLAAIVVQLPVPVVFAQQQSPPDAASGPPPSPASAVSAEDVDDDNGTKLRVTWTLSPDDLADAKPRAVVRYDILRAADGSDEFSSAGEVTYQKNSLTDEECEPGVAYHYQVVAVSPDGARSEPAQTKQATTPIVQWFDGKRAWFGIILLIVGGSVVYFINAARRGREIKLRQIAGLEAVSEAVGRATEMGRPCLFIPGIEDVNYIQTVAGISVLSRVAKLIAEYGSSIEIPTARPLVMTTAKETVQAAYLAAGRPDAFNEDNIYYLTNEQFGYVAAVMGTMSREKPAACFYMGAFYAESLILAETGNSIGAIQIAGTAMPAQLPFFVAACDYTLIGEEFFAASAILSGDSQQLGSLKGQDVGKIICGVLVLAGCVVATWAALTDSQTATGIVAFMRDNILGSEGFLPR